MEEKKRCLYEVLGLPTTCSAEEIRAAYRRLALQRHPDKLVKSGLTQEEATSSFQELLNAYDLLSDPKERCWYDSHRSQILFSTPLSTPSQIPHLFPLFSNSAFSGFSHSPKGFYTVYSLAFDSIYATEVHFATTMGLPSVNQAPILGNLESGYHQAKSFFDYWAGFVTVLDFSWSEQYDSGSGATRKSRRVMQEENRKLRKKAKREYSETVRGLAEFVKKRDKRVIEMLVKKEAENAKRREEEKNRLKAREKEKADRARMYQEPAWSRIDEEQLSTIVFEEEEEEEEDGGKKEQVHELYCILCGKKFKSDKQWENHEQSKRHKEKLVQMKHSLFDKQEVFENCVDDLSEEVGGTAGIGEKEEAGVSSSDDETFLSFDDCDDENMVSADLTSAGVASSAMDDDGNEAREGDAEDGDTVECDTVRKTSSDEDVREKPVEIKSSMSNHTIGDSHIENDVHNKNEQQCRGDDMSPSQPMSKKGATTRPATKNAKNSEKTSKKKQQQQQQQQSASFSKRGGRNNKSNTCETCGHDFESRNQLHKHLGDTGHASLKYRF